MKDFCKITLKFSDFCENYGRFSKIGLYNFCLKLSIWHPHDQFMHYSTGPIYRLLTLKEFFRLDHFLGKNSFFEKKNFVVGDFEEGIGLEPWNLLGWSPGDWQFGKSLCILPVLFVHARFATGDGWSFDSRCLFGGNSSLRNRLHGVEPWDVRLSVRVPYDAAVFNKGSH